MRLQRRLASLSISAALLATTAAPPRAEACGGLFCDSGNPVNQKAERIIFKQEKDGSVTAVIEIQYEGPPDKFAWMLPVAGSPTVRVSSNSALDALQGATNPLYRLNTTTEGVCRGEGRFSSDGVSAGGGSADAAVESPEDDGVTVVDEGTVGPYDYVIISVDPDEDDQAATAIAWLQTNDFDVSDFAGDRLRPYLEGGMNLLTFRLTKGNDAGSIRPVLLDFGTGLPMIPIRPTAVAATNDMGVMVWVIGEHRAVPANYFSLELNEALLNWLNPNSNYNDVIIRAANEAGGQGFVTEYAANDGSLAESVYPQWQRSAWDSIKSNPGESDGELVARVVQDLAGIDGAAPLLKTALGIDDDDLSLLGSCAYCVLTEDDGFEDGYCRGEGAWCEDVTTRLADDIAGFDRAEFVSDFEEQVIKPLADTAALFGQNDYVTRLYTTLSPEEMTKDPAFDFNVDLPTYSNLHVADRVIECNPAVDRADATWRVTFANGWVVRGKGGDWPFSVEEGELPANARVIRIGTTGTGEVVTDNVSAIQSALSDSNAKYPRAVVAGGGGLCAVSAGGSDRAAWLALGGALGVVLGFMRRRRVRG